MKKTTEKLSALIITFNEMGYIERCLESISFADEIIVVDSYSTDGTYEYLKSRDDVKVIQHPFENFTLQKSFALSQASHDWVLFLDADEVVPVPLQAEILDTLAGNPTQVAFWFYRQFMFGDVPLRYSGWQTDKNYRLFRRSKAHFTDRKIVHETLEVEGTCGILQEKLIHYCYKNHGDYKAKMLHYGQLKAQEDFFRERRFNYFFLIAKPLWKFFNHYFLRLGILDGRKGMIICHLNALGVLERYRELKKLEKRHELAYYLVMP